MGKKKEKPLEALTRLEQERQIKRSIGEEVEKIDATGQESEIKAKKWVEEAQREEDKKQQEQDAIIWDKLTTSSHKIFTYRSSLFTYLRQLKDSYELDPGYIWGVKDTKKGFAIYVRNREHKWFAKGTTISGIPKFDINAVERLVYRALEFVDQSEEKIERYKKEKIVV